MSEPEHQRALLLQQGSQIHWGVRFGTPVREFLLLELLTTDITLSHGATLRGAAGTEAGLPIYPAIR